METLDHRGGLAATTGIVTDGYGGLHLVLLYAERPETNGRPQGVCKLLITLGQTTSALKEEDNVGVMMIKSSPIVVG